VELAGNYRTCNPYARRGTPQVNSFFIRKMDKLTTLLFVGMPREFCLPLYRPRQWLHLLSCSIAEQFNDGSGKNTSLRFEYFFRHNNQFLARSDGINYQLFIQLFLVRIMTFQTPWISTDIFLYHLALALIFSNLIIQPKTLSCWIFILLIPIYL
jgi:hypothetical protein